MNRTFDMEPSFETENKRFIEILDTVILISMAILVGLLFLVAYNYYTEYARIESIPIVKIDPIEIHKQVVNEEEIYNVPKEITFVKSNVDKIEHVDSKTSTTYLLDSYVKEIAKEIEQAGDITMITLGSNANDKTPFYIPNYESSLVIKDAEILLATIFANRGKIIRVLTIDNNDNLLNYEDVKIENNDKNKTNIIEIYTSLDIRHAPNTPVEFLRYFSNYRTIDIIATRYKNNIQNVIWENIGIGKG